MRAGWLLVLSLTGCVGSDVMDVTTPGADEPPAPQVTSLLRPPYAVILERPVLACAENPWIAAPDLANTRVGEPVLAETFGADGCLDERWIWEWDGAQKTHEVYDFFDPDLALYVYGVLTPYSHRWMYDTDGRVVRETRALEVDGEPFQGVASVYDREGRLVEHVRTGDAGVIEQRERWTYTAQSDEFGRYELFYSGEVQDTERRVFDAAGRIIEVHGSRAGQPEHLVRRIEYVDGRMVRLWSWDQHTAAPESEHIFAYREDGSLSRQTVYNLRMGWLDVREFDEAERQVLYTQDEDQDGRIEYREVHRYDDAGNLVFSSTEYDFDAPRPRYAETRSVFDDQGRMVEVVRDQPWMDGNARRTRTAFDASGPGFTVSDDILTKSGNVLRTESTARYHDVDRLEWRRTDPERDGTLSSLEVRYWDGARPLETLWDRDDDGAVDGVEQWRYDAAGQLVAHAVDHDGDGVADALALYER